jgi:menaquinone-dependent protoporphyrinogen oxidase
MKVLVVYGTTEGQTRKIAEFMADVLKGAGHEPLIANAAEQAPTPTAFDAIIVGGSIHINKYQSAVVNYIRHNVDTLNNTPAAFFSVCMAAASKNEKERGDAERITTEFLQRIGWRPMLTTQVAGALKYTQYGFFKRLVMKYIAKKEGGATDTSHDYEYTDWNAVKEFVTLFVEKAKTPITH